MPPNLLHTEREGLRFRCPTPPPHMAALPGGAHPAAAAAEPMQVDQPHPAAAGAAPADAKVRAASLLFAAREVARERPDPSVSSPSPSGVWWSLRSIRR
jgi:hypothetical protein